LRTSRGLALSTRSSSFGCSASFDGLIGEGLSRRIIPSIEEIQAQISLAGDYLPALRHSGGEIENGKRMVILHPSVAYSMFSYFVWGNLSGSAIYHGQSPYQIDTFGSGQPVFREDISVRIDPWQPLGTGSFMYTSEGLPSEPTTYIERGRLTQPILDLKYARRLNLPPTTPPGGEESIQFESDTEATWEDLLAHMDEAILVLSVLGLHTQDRTSGNYSLSTSQALLIRDGEIQGRVKATLNGNLFENLRDESLRFVRFQGQHSPGFALPLMIAAETTA
jgi:PmbA protein